MDSKNGGNIIIQMSIRKHRQRIMTQKKTVYFQWPFKTAGGVSALACVVLDGRFTTSRKAED